MAAVSPFARSNAFEDARIPGREYPYPRVPTSHTRIGSLQIEEMYSVPESFLEIEVRNPQTHGVPSSISLESRPPTDVCVCV